MDLSFVGYQLNCFDRLQTDFVLCGVRPDGSALSGLPKPFTLILFVLTFLLGDKIAIRKIRQPILSAASNKYKNLRTDT